MEKLLKNAFLILLGLNYCSCNWNNTKVPTYDIKDELRKSKDFSTFLDLTRHMSEGVKSGKYNYFNLNKNYVRNHIPKGVPIDKIPTELLCSIYQKAGITNVNDYVKTEVDMSIIYRKILREFPKLATMSTMDRIRLFRAIRLTQTRK